MTKSRIAIIDDHRILREGLVELLRGSGDVAVVGTGSTAADALRIVATFEPDVLIIDLDMAASKDAPSGLQVIEQVRRTHPQVKIVVLTMQEDVTTVQRCIDAGVSAYLIKRTGRLELQAALEGAIHIPDSIFLSISRRTARALSEPAVGQNVTLTPREAEVLRHLAATGSSNSAIARELHIAEATVKRHLAAIYDKLGTRTRVQTVREAQSLGLLTNPDR